MHKKKTPNQPNTLKNPKKQGECSIYNKVYYSTAYYNSNNLILMS